MDSFDKLYRSDDIVMLQYLLDNNKFLNGDNIILNAASYGSYNILMYMCKYYEEHNIIINIDKYDGFILKWLCYHDMTDVIKCFVKYSEKYNIKLNLDILFESNNLIMPISNIEMFKYLSYLKLHNYNNKYYRPFIFDYVQQLVFNELSIKKNICGQLNNISIYCSNNNIIIKYDDTKIIFFTDEKYISNSFYNYSFFIC